MPLTPIAARAVARCGLRPDDVALVLRRMADALPHLDLSEWDAAAEAGPGVGGAAGGGAGPCRLHLPLGGARLVARVTSPVGPVARSDRVILRELTEEARHVLEAPGRARGALSDFGLTTFSRTVARLLAPRLGWETVLGTLRGLRALASETYEGHRISYGLIFTARPGRGDAPLLSLENKRFKTLTDGFSTALLLDRRGGLAGIVALHRVALELALRRSGGLLVVASSREAGRKLVVSRGDLLGSPRRPVEERWLDASLEGRLVHRTDRRIVADLASVDGALIVDRTGKLMAYGAMVRTSSSRATQGARSRAAVAASRLGLAMKVSSDGGISVYRHGNPVVSL